MDRNYFFFVPNRLVWESPSSRRAWIEIIQAVLRVGSALVALLAEGVDRNLLMESWYSICSRSPSSRRAWIEISESFTGNLKKRMSPSSRRAWIEI